MVFTKIPFKSFVSVLTFGFLLVFSYGCQSLKLAGRASDLRVDHLLYVESARASYYSMSFAGRQTANGEEYNPNLLTAAHPTLPFGTILVVRRKKDGRYVMVRVNDRGPYVSGRRVDLSMAAARKLGVLVSGVVPVDIFVLPPESQLKTLL